MSLNRDWKQLMELALDRTIKKCFPDEYDPTLKYGDIHPQMGNKRKGRKEN